MLDKESLKPVIESLIFASESPISIEKLASVLEGEEKPVIKEALKELIEDYKNRAGGFLIEEVAGGYVFRTNPEFSPWLRRLFKIGLQKISKAAMESLAIIAYKQPVTRGELESIRGVDSGGVLATLMEKRFIKIVGRKEVPGRPVVYGTTREFLETFDLKDLSCLPSLKDIQRMEEENAAENPEGAKDSIEDTIQDSPEGEGGVEDGFQETGPAEAGPDAEDEDLEALAEEAFSETEDTEGGSPGGAGEAPEDNSPGGDNVPEEGGGADNPGAGEGEPQDGDGAGGQGRP